MTLAGGVSIDTRTIAKGVALATNGSVSTDGASNEVVLVHLDIEQLTAKHPYPLPNSGFKPSRKADFLQA